MRTRLLRRRGKGARGSRACSLRGGSGRRCFGTMGLMERGAALRGRWPDEPDGLKGKVMKARSRLVCCAAVGAAALMGRGPAARGADGKPNIVVIMGDDIGMWNIGAYHRGMMAGRTPNLDKIAKEGMLFTDYYAEGSCTAGRANFITAQLPIRTGMTTVGRPARRSGCRRRP